MAVEPTKNSGEQSRKRKRDSKKSQESAEDPNSKHSSIFQKYKSAVGHDLDEALSEVRSAENSLDAKLTQEEQERQKLAKAQEDEMEIAAAGLVPLPQPAKKEKKILAPIRDQWMTEPQYVKPTLSKPFKSLLLSDHMVKNLAAMGFEKSFAVQAAVIPALMEDIIDISPDPKKPILVNAATGSGKTLAYGVPIVEALSKRVVPKVRALIILPTRPLVQQVREVIETLARGTGLRVMAFRSERSFSEEQALLRKMTPDIIITNPGRLVDHVRSTADFSLKNLQYMVIDEADRLLNQSFQEWVDVVIGALQERSSNQESIVADTWTTHTQKLVFSATLTKDAGKWASLKIKQPRIFVVGDKSTTAGEEEFSVPFTLTEYMVQVPDVLTKPLILLNLLTQESISSDCIIFTRSNETAARLVKLLSMLDRRLRMKADKSLEQLTIGLVNGEVDTNKRKKTLKEFAKGEISLIICTDIIARGMDIESVKHVINYDIPISGREYIHRVGRTARAGKEGTAWSLVSRPEAKWFKEMAGKIKRSKTQKLLRREVTVWEGQEEVYETALESLERQVKGTTS
ncbi:hypothetical protein BZA70DRAFT_280654 [Myxozyma melibiosi]|uniref:RNA helicase n=1 Tax=Myxozyma melibiosi TaxID=54550 RepID=A0ABR1F3I2_9ASCO